MAPVFDQAAPTPPPTHPPSPIRAQWEEEPEPAWKQPVNSVQNPVEPVQPLDSVLNSDVDAEELKAELRDLIHVIKDVGASKFANNLIAQGNEEAAEKIEHVSDFAEENSEFGNLDLSEVKSEELEEIKEELNDIVQEQDVQDIVDSEAIESAQEVFDELQNSIDQEIEEDEGNEDSPIEELPMMPEVPSDPELPGQPEIPAESVYSDPDEAESEEKSDFDLPENQEAEPAGFEEAIENEQAEPEEPAVAIPNDPWFDAPNRWAAGQENQEESQLTAENPENSFEVEENSENVQESDSYEQASNEEAPVEQLIPGFETEDAGNSEESLNLERPIGVQELQSLRAENLQTSEDQTILEIQNQTVVVTTKPITTTTTTTTTTPMNKDDFIPMEQRERAQPSQQAPSIPPLPNLSDSPVASENAFHPQESDLSMIDPLKPVSIIDPTAGQRRLDSDEEEPIGNQGFGNQVFGNQGFGNQNPFGNQGFGIGNPMINPMMNQMNPFMNQMNPGFNQFNSQPKPNIDPDEFQPVPRKAVGNLSPGEFPTDCNHLYNLGQTVDGVYIIKPSLSASPKKVKCEFKHSGGWTVFQIRYDGTTDFYQDWESYRHGFGRPEGEYWLGLDSVHLLTSRAPTRLRIDLNDAAGHTAYVEHENFFIDDESESYKLHVGLKRHGNLEGSFQGQAGEKFSTFDRDNDRWKTNCAEELHGGGWFSACSYVNLNGRYYPSGISSGTFNDGIYWAKFPSEYRPPDPQKPQNRLSAYRYSMTSVKMAILVDPNKN